jgi:hypothetical protein
VRLATATSARLSSLPHESKNGTGILQVKRAALVLFFTLLTLTGQAALADTVGDLLKQYESQGASAFNAATAQAMWTQPFTDAKSGDKRHCSLCHSEDLRRTGKHAVTGKPIEPLAPSANPKRLTDAEHVEKWLARNCKWTLGRECTPQEKGNFLVMIRAK